MNVKKLFDELKRRNVYKIAIAYTVTGWLIIQAASIASDTFGAPAWVMKMLITILLLGFPIAIIFAWAFEITPDGIKRTRRVPVEYSITNKTGQKLNYWIIGVLSAALLFLLVDRFWVKDSSSPLATSASMVPTVAVLPFQDFSPANDQEWFSDGLTEELLNSLARLKGLKVAARTSSFYFKNKNIPIQQIADTLGVEHIVEGSVRRADSTVRISAQLIRASDGYHLWSQTYDRNVKDVFKIQEDISENIASALNVYLDDDEREKMFAFGTRNVEAYNAYLKGRNIYDKLHEKSVDVELFTEAAPWFEKSIKSDPNFAAPYYFLADPYTHYILEYPAIQIDSLNLQKAQNRIFHYLNEAIDHTSDPGQRLMYEFERTFLSGNWSSIPRLVEELKNNPEVQRAYAMIGGWTRSFLSMVGHARLQYNLNMMKLERDPLDNGVKSSTMQALSNYASADSMFSALKQLGLDSNPQYNNSGSFMFTYLRIGHINKADSIAQSVTNSPVHPVRIIMHAVKGHQEEAAKKLEQFPNNAVKNNLSFALIYYVVGDVQKATGLALKIDTTTLGPQKLLLELGVQNGGFLPFTLDSLPNLSLLLNQAGVSIKPERIGEISIPKIQQKGL